MTSHTAPADVIADLGDKVCDGFHDAITRTRDDLAEYRQTSQRLSARHSPTGLANWLADQMMANLVEELDDVDGVDFVNGKGHTREILIRGTSGGYYRFRAKRHYEGGSVATHPTEAALDFMTQDDDLLLFDDFTEIKLTVGYIWDALLQQVGEAVVSLRDDKGTRVVWMREVPLSGAAAVGGTVVTFPQATGGPTVPTSDEAADGPAGPIVELPDLRNDDAADGGDSER